MALPINGMQASNQGTPIPVLTQTTTGSTELTFSSDYPFTYKLYNGLGQQIYVVTSFADNIGGTVSPLYAKVDMSSYIDYPAQVGVGIYDAISLLLLNQLRLTLVGGDTYKIRLTYPTRIPAAEGYYSVSIDGRREVIPLTDLQYYLWAFGDVHTQGADGGGGYGGNY